MDGHKLDLRDIEWRRRRGWRNGLERWPLAAPGGVFSVRLPRNQQRHIECQLHQPERQSGFGGAQRDRRRAELPRLGGGGPACLAYQQHQWQRRYGDGPGQFAQSMCRRPVRHGNRRQWKRQLRGTAGNPGWLDHEPASRREQFFQSDQLLAFQPAGAGGHDARNHNGRRGKRISECHDHLLLHGRASHRIRHRSGIGGGFVHYSLRRQHLHGDGALQRGKRSCWLLPDGPGLLRGRAIAFLRALRLDAFDCRQRGCYARWQLSGQCQRPRGSLGIVCARL